MEVETDKEVLGSWKVGRRRGWGRGGWGQRKCEGRREEETSRARGERD